MCFRSVFSPEIATTVPVARPWKPKLIKLIRKSHRKPCFLLPPLTKKGKQNPRCWNRGFLSPASDYLRQRKKGRRFIPDGHGETYQWRPCKRQLSEPGILHLAAELSEMGGMGRSDGKGFGWEGQLNWFWEVFWWFLDRPSIWEKFIRSTSLSFCPKIFPSVLLPLSDNPPLLRCQSRSL